MTVKDFLETQPIITAYSIKPKRLMKNHTLDTFNKCQVKKVELEHYLDIVDFVEKPQWIITIDAKEVV